MKKTYYYGLADDEEYYHTDIDSAYEDIKNEYDEDGIGMTIIEMVKSKKSGMRWCEKECKFIEYSGFCGKFECDDYQPRNGKNGICKHLSWGLVETGRKFKITGDYKYKKISGRIREVEEIG